MRFDPTGAPKGLPPPYADGTIYMMSNSYLQLLGRSHGRIGLDKVFQPTEPNALAGGCPWAMRSAALSPKGRLVACCGMEAEGNPVLDLGEIAPGGVQLLVDSANSNIVVNAIALLGPYYVQQFVRARKSDIAFRPHYATVCEICEDIVSRSDVLEHIEENVEALAAAVRLARFAIC